MPLTELGRKQARDQGENIVAKGLVFDAVFASPLDRALETAKIISEVIGAPEPLVHDDLIERDFGIMTGKRAADIEKLCAPDIIKTDPVVYFLSPEGAETFPDLIARARRLIEDINKLAASKTVLLVTHGDIGKMIYACATNTSWEQVLTDFHFGNADILGPLEIGG